MLYRNFFKRIFDFCLALILFILLLPVMIITSIIIHFSTGRPFLPEIRLREGRYKKTFKMYKFRTKIYGWEDLPFNERYTKVTRIIDISRINELPQLWNIIKGDMSLIGPRPFNVGDELPDIPIPKERYLLRPGVTGLAQVKYGRNATHQNKLDSDVEYYRNLSFWLDFKIMIKTPSLIINTMKTYLHKKQK